MNELETPAAESQSSNKTARATWWTLGVLTFVSILDWADRALISVIAEPLRHEFELSDTELGFSMAFAFGIIRVFIGIPVGRLADTHNRRNILASALAIWSVMTVAFGMARNYTQLILARVVIGAGTTGAYPPTVSMISDGIDKLITQPWPIRAEIARYAAAQFQDANARNRKNL